MSDNMLGFNTLGRVFHYRSPTTLFHLDSFSFEHLLTELKQHNNTVKFTEQTAHALGLVFKTIKEDSILYHEKDLKIIIDLTLSEQKEVILHIFSKTKLLPFCGFGGDTNLYWDMTLDELNNLTIYTLDEKEILHCKINPDYIYFLKKIDSLLDYNNALCEDMLKHGLYPRSSNLEYPLFDISFTDSSLSISSKVKFHFGSIVDPHFFQLRFDLDRNLVIKLAGQELSFSKTEFKETSNQEIIEIIMRLLKIKKLPIESMSHLKDYLLLQEMNKI